MPRVYTLSDVRSYSETSHLLKQNGPQNHQDYSATTGSRNQKSWCSCKYFCCKCCYCSHYFCPGFRIKSFAFVLSCTQICVYAVCWILTQNEKGDRTVFSSAISQCILYKAGAKYGPSLRFGYRFDRLFLPELLHANLVHLCVNIFSQIQLLSLFEGDNQLVNRYSLVCKEFALDRKKLSNLLALSLTAVFYIFSGSSSVLFSAVMSPYSLSVGASGSLCGLLGLWVTFIISRWQEFDSSWRVKQAINLLLIFAANFSLSLTSASVDTYAHVGGLIFGTVNNLLNIRVKT